MADEQLPSGPATVPAKPSPPTPPAPPPKGVAPVQRPPWQRDGGPPRLPSMSPQKPLSDANILRELLQGLEQAKAVLHYYLVLEEDAEPAKVKEFTTRETLVAELRTLVDKPKPGMRVLIFQGSRLFLSKGPYKFLIAGSEKIPLFVVPAEAEVDEAGYLVPEPQVQIVPPAIEAESEQEEKDGNNSEDEPDPLGGEGADPLR